MKIIMHYPMADQDNNFLQKQIAMVHANVVETYLNDIPCTKEQKVRLIKEIQGHAKSKQ